MEDERRITGEETGDAAEEVAHGRPKSSSSEGGHRHSHGSHHAHHHSHSRHKRHRSSHRGKKTLIDRVQAWIDKTFDRRGVTVIGVAVLLLIVLLFLGIYLSEARRENPPPPAGGMPSTSAPSTTTGAPSSSPIPAYWEETIAQKTKTVTHWQMMGGRDAFSFVFASDTHIPDNDSARTDDIGKLMAKMMDNCAIPFAIITGDVGTRASLDTEEALSTAQAQIPVHLAPLFGTERLLMALGNHDGCYGDASCYYQKQQSPEKLWEVYFRRQALDSRRVFSEDGSYFYVDNAVQKTRFIVLNSHFGGEYLVDGSGCAVNDRFSISCYGQEQLDWLAEVALDMPQGYGAIIAAHVPPSIDYTVDKDQLIGIINAYCQRGSYNGSYTAGVNGWTNSTVNVNFSDAEGEIIAMVAGHVHGDSVDTDTLACPLITVRAAGAASNGWFDGATEVPKRTPGTATETSFDVVTVNRKTRTIYCTRIGGGEDRVIPY